MRGVVNIIRSKPVILITTSSSIVTLHQQQPGIQHQQYQRQQQQQVQKQEQQQQQQQMVILGLTWASFSKARSSIRISQRFELSRGSTPAKEQCYLWKHIQGGLFIWPSPFSVQKVKLLRANHKLTYIENFIKKIFSWVWLVFLFSIENGEGQLNKPPCMYILNFLIG